jgi:hypothetical protein
MPTPLPTEARTQLATWLATTDYRVETTVPKVPSPPVLVIVPDAPWITPGRVPALAFDVNLKVMCVARDNAEGIDVLEDMVHQVIDSVDGQTQWSDATAPQTLDLGAQGTVLVSEVSITIHVKE